MLATDNGTRTAVCISKLSFLVCGQNHWKNVVGKSSKLSFLVCGQNHWWKKKFGKIWKQKLWGSLLIDIVPCLYSLAKDISAPRRCSYCQKMMFFKMYRCKHCRWVYASYGVVLENWQWNAPPNYQFKAKVNEWNAVSQVKKKKNVQSRESQKQGKENKTAHDIFTIPSTRFWCCHQLHSFPSPNIDLHLWKVHFFVQSIVSKIIRNEFVQLFESCCPSTSRGTSFRGLRSCQVFLFLNDNLFYILSKYGHAQLTTIPHMNEKKHQEKRKQKPGTMFKLKTCCRVVE